MKLNMPATALPYILYQRTDYLEEYFLNRLLNYCAYFLPWLHKSTVQLRALFYKTRIQKAYSEDMNTEFTSIREYIPMQAHATLDIGCGVAGINALLSEHYNHTVDIHLLDKTLTDPKVYYGFEKRGSYYNSLEVARELLVVNGVPEAHVFLHDTTSLQQCFTKDTYDLVTSFISWGFHYPLDTYLGGVYQSLKSGGRLIVDLRADTNGMSILEDTFQTVQVIHTNNKLTRVCATKS